jgi:hypothetical protein
MKATYLRLMLMVFMMVFIAHLDHKSRVSGQNSIYPYCGGPGIPPITGCPTPSSFCASGNCNCQYSWGDEFWDQSTCCCRSDIGHTCVAPVDQNYCQPPSEGCSSYDSSAYYDYTYCCCFSTQTQSCIDTPIVMDLADNGYHLTDDRNGVNFDMYNNGFPIRWSWTGRGEDDSFLALDRNHDGLISAGAELFGKLTPQPQSTDRNGFTALAVFDLNLDGQINAQDPVYTQLQIWTDDNHDGISQTNELFSLPSKGVSSISTDYHLSRRSDRWGNLFRYKSKAIINGTEKPIWDVIFFHRSQTLN